MRLIDIEWLLESTSPIYELHTMSHPSIRSDAMHGTRSDTGGEVTRVVLADDHPVILDALTSALMTQADIRVVATVTSSTELITTLDHQPCDVLVSDYCMPGGQHGDGHFMFGVLKRRYPTLPIVVFTMRDQIDVMHFLARMDLHVIVSKRDSVSHVVTAVNAAREAGSYRSPTISKLYRSYDTERIASSASPLTRRETDVVEKFVSGMSVDQIAAQLHRSKQTISSQKSGAKRKLGISNDTDLIKFWLARDQNRVYR